MYFRHPDKRLVEVFDCLGSILSCLVSNEANPAFGKEFCICDRVSTEVLLEVLLGECRRQSFDKNS